MKQTRECNGYTYTAEDEDGDSPNWSVNTDYINNQIYLTAPTDEEDIEQIELYGKAIVRACKDMKKDMKSNVEYI